MEESDCPYRAEYAKSNRSKCKACKVGIEKDHLRLAVMIQSPLFDGKVPNWYHFNCFFIKQRPKDATDIAHFESIRWEDQEKIKTKLVSLIGTSITPVSRKKKSGTKNPDFNVEYAKSGRAGCCGCQEKIVKNDVRIGKMDYESEEAHRFGGLNRWYHVECFVKLREELEFRGSASSLNGYNILNVEDKNNLTNLLPILATKRTIATNSDKTDGPSSSKKSKLIDKDLEKKAQNKLLFKYIDFLKSLKNTTCKELLEFNKQEVPNSNLGEIYDRLSDLMAFGTLLPCGECNGQLVFRSGIGYQCSGFKNEWLKYEKVLVNPPRKEFVVPSHLLENNDFFVTYKSKIQKRIFTLIDKTTNIKETSTVKNEKGAVRVTRILPLRNMEFTTLMKGSELKDIKFQVAKHGGTLISQCTENVAAVFANQEMIGKKSVKVKDAEEHNIEVVEPTSFFDAIANGRNAIEFIVEKNLASWGGNAKKRIKKRQNELETEQIHKSGLKSKVYGKSMYEKSVPTSVKLTLKGGVPVEPQSGLEHKTHVYKHKNEIWNANLCLSDVQTGKNSYYKLQLLESDNNKKYWVFRSWGRIGTTIGGFKTQDFDTLDEAQEQFQLFYEEQTGNVWGNKNFVKVPGKKVPVDTDYGQDETKALDTVSKIPCKLPDPVQSLIRLLFDVESMKKVMYEFELDLQKMPLGKLSRKQLQKAYSLLSDLMSIIDISDNGNKREKIIMTTNKFYTLIPHDFGVKTPQLIDSNEIINAKLEMIGSLMEIQIAYDMIDVKTQEDSIVHPLDTHYLKLNCGIDVLNTDMREFSIIEQYVKNTHAETHNTYSLKIKDVFKILRTGEEKRFKPFKKLHNRKLLWHGSRITNFAAILSQGLRIAPKEAPVTGYMFGKGIYFADMVSKSANYCMASHGNNTGLLLLCEVALGNMDEHKQSIYIEKLPSGKHSCMGIGRTIPDPTESLLIDNKVEVPLGKPIPSNIDDTSLLYNEFIVYDISQVKLRYLVKVEFNFNF